MRTDPGSTQVFLFRVISGSSSRKETMLSRPPADAGGTDMRDVAFVTAECGLGAVPMLEERLSELSHGPNDVESAKEPRR